MNQNQNQYQDLIYFNFKISSSDIDWNFDKKCFKECGVT